MPVSRPHRTAAAVLAVGLLCLTGACGSTSEAEPAEAAAAEVTQAASSTPATPGTPEATPAAPEAPYEGTWRAGPVPYSVVVDALESAGLGQSVDTVLQGSSPSSEVTYDLKVQGGFVLLTSTVDDRTLGVQDRESFTAGGSSITLEPIGSSCASTFTWRVKADRLTFALREDSCPGVQGTPDEAFMRALYTAVPFERVTG